MAEHGTSSVRVVDVCDIPSVWESHARDYINKCLCYQIGEDSDSIYQALLAGSMWLVDLCVDGVPVASATLTVVSRPTTKTLECLHMGGSGIDRWGDVFSSFLDDVAKDNNCSDILVMGRAGIERKYRRWGFSPSAIQLKRKVV